MVRLIKEQEIDEIYSQFEHMDEKSLLLIIDIELQGTAFIYDELKDEELELEKEQYSLFQSQKERLERYTAGMGELVYDYMQTYNQFVELFNPPVPEYLIDEFTNGSDKAIYALKAMNEYLHNEIDSIKKYQNGMRILKTSFLDICVEYVQSSKEALFEKIGSKNYNSAKYFKDIINLIAPRIGGVYDEISAKAIVGTLTLICRNGISNYIN